MEPNQNSQMDLKVDLLEKELYKLQLIRITRLFPVAEQH